MQLLHYPSNKKSIHTLITDVYDLIRRKDGWFTKELADEMSAEIARRLRGQFEVRKAPTLRLSKMGPVCPKALWHSIHTPDQSEPLPPAAEFKYGYGHVLEAYAITLAKAAGHEVTGEQDEVVVDGISGHRDCVIDGHVVDVKSCTSIGFKKFKDRSLAHTDSFGYLEQLDGYLVGSYEDPLVRVKDTGFLWAIDKNLGNMCLYEHQKRELHIRQRIRECKEIVACNVPPACQCGTRPHGKSGNIELDTKASYSAFKHVCFPNLRTFIYADGPVYLTKVLRKPDVIEVDRYGVMVYN